MEFRRPLGTAWIVLSASATALLAGLLAGLLAALVLAALML